MTYFPGKPGNFESTRKMEKKENSLLLKVQSSITYIQYFLLVEGPFRLICSRFEELFYDNCHQFWIRSITLNCFLSRKARIASFEVDLGFLSWRDLSIINLPKSLVLSVSLIKPSPIVKIFSSSFNSYSTGTVIF